MILIVIGYLLLCAAGTYEAYAYINGKQKFIKTFKTIEEAIKARNEMEV